jgi:hypothetical protein
MFLHILTDRQQAAFLSLARQFIEADQVLSDEESNHLELMMAETGWDFDEEVPVRPVDELAPVFETPAARKVALLELIAVGHADDQFHPDEDAFVQDLARRWDVSAADVARLEAYVQKQTALIAEAQELLAG